MHQLLRLIIKYCTKIRYFKSGMPDNIYIYSLIKSNEQNINYLNIELDFYDYHTTNYDEYSSTVLQNLGQVLPFKLEYLCLTLLFNINDLANCKNNEDDEDDYEDDDEDNAEELFFKKMK
ncbi:hypothetical protein RhiirA4_475885 [Rhizophagus irregularis]|uniref:Uncharacterized protein n=1 Tax=Rhizophagus irregularis TaxID=588596 RepID=A0A2I1HAR5_9GLOM|nr:hypothetical protein RhiirA4_475885 [Rhizophagus irregularis]